MLRRFSLLTASSIALTFAIGFSTEADAGFHLGREKSTPAAAQAQTGSAANAANQSSDAQNNSLSGSKKNKARTKTKVKAKVKSKSSKANKPATIISGNEEAPSNANAPFVVPPSSLDITTAKFGKLDIDLKEASFLEARVHDIHLIADRMDMATGTLYALIIRVDQGEFQDFTIDGLEMSTAGSLHFSTAELLNNKVLQFLEPANAQARLIISQSSLNRFLNSTDVLEKLSGSAKKRVPILSTLARKDVNFGFTFTGGKLELEPDDHIRLSMDSKLGMGKAGMPIQLVADTRLTLDNGWVNLADTHLVTGGQSVPHDMAARIVRRINSLSKWGNASDDIQFQFTSLKVTPNNQLELEGTATIKRLRFVRNPLDIDITAGSSESGQSGALSGTATPKSKSEPAPIFPAKEGSQPQNSLAAPQSVPVPQNPKQQLQQPVPPQPQSQP